MSVMITLKRSMARNTDAALSFVQHGLMITVLLLALGIVNVFAKGTPSADKLKSALPDFVVSEETTKTAATVEPATIALSARMQGALDYVTHRYRVSPEALAPVFEAAQLIGKERRIDPLLIVAVIGIESGFNPFAENATGAQGLMQVIPRFHMDKLPDGAGTSSLLDPRTNIKVGVHVLEEAIRRRGSVVAGLQYYAGSSDREGSYASKVLAEKERLEQAARRRTGDSA